ncbi:hypothetical protein ODR10_25925, partial [Escherichia coli]|nr:hypothetical protein [Escherichia coli]
AERETTGVEGKAERLTWHKAWTAVSSGFSISYTSRQRLFCKYPLKRAVSHSERFFRFRMVSPWLYRTKRQKAIQGFSVKDPKRINQRIV